jgi:quercetin dioxygenase-like cupin family protein
MSEAEAKRMLREEGFSCVYTWEDSPNAQHAPHTHSTKTAHVVLQGSIWVKVDGREAWYSKGDRFDVPANTQHQAKAGPNGCKYVIGEK